MLINRRDVFVCIALAAALAVTYVAGQVWLAGGDDAPPLTEPREWITEAEQEALADALTSIDGVDAWVAGCVWERERGDIADVVSLPGGYHPLPHGSSHRACHDARARSRHVSVGQR